MALDRGNHPHCRGRWSDHRPSFHRGSSPSPPPGDPIIIRPRPTDRNNASFWVTIGGDDPIPVAYGGNNWLNDNAYTYIEDFYARVDIPKPGGGTRRIKAQIKKLTAQYQHCSTNVMTQCA